MRSMQLVNGLDLEQEPFVYQNIDPERGLEAQAIELNVYWMLSGTRIAHSSEVPRQDHFIDRLEQAGPKLPMEPYGRIEHIAADPVYVPHAASLRLCVSASLREP